MLLADCARGELDVCVVGRVLCRAVELYRVVPTLNKLAEPAHTPVCVWPPA